VAAWTIGQYAAFDGMGNNQSSPAPAKGSVTCDRIQKST
jgi:hypothetical protein